MTWDGAAFSLRLMRMLKLRSLTIGGACARAGIDRGLAYRYLEGNVAPSPRTLVLLAWALGCDPGWLLFGNRQMGVISSDQELSDRMLVARIPMPRAKGDPLVWTGPNP